MNSQQVDEQLLVLLNDLQYFSRLKTCLQIRLADYAAQQCGCRSTRQILDSVADEVEENYSYLLNLLPYYTYECIKYINESHTFKQEILDLDDMGIEDTLEAALFNMIIFDCSRIFIEYFLDE